MDEAIKYITYVINISTLSRCKISTKKLIIVQDRNNVIRNVAISALIIAFIVAVVSREFVKKDFVSKGSIALAVEFVIFYGQAPVCMISILIIFVQVERIAAFFNRMLIICHDFNELKFNDSFNSYVKKLRMLLIVCGVKVLFLQIPMIFRTINMVNAVYITVGNFSFLALYLMNLIWMSAVLMLLHVYKVLNGMLHTLKYRQFWVVSDYVKAVEVPTLRLLRSCAEVQNALYELARLVGSIFGWPLLMNMPMLFLEVIFNTFSVCHMMQGLTTFATRNIVYDVLYFMAFVEIIVPCILVKEQSEKFINRLNKVDLGFDYDGEMDALVSNLSLQMYHQKVEFTVFGILPLDGTLVYSIFGAITTYLVILLQFYG